MRRTPKKRPPEPDPECPSCGQRHGKAECDEVNVTEYDSGAVEGDLACPETGEVVIEGVLFQQPEVNYE